MAEFFHTTTENGEIKWLRLTEDAPDELGFVGEPADSYTVLSLANVSRIVERVRGGTTVSVCSEVAVAGMHDKTDPLELGKALKRFGRLTPTEGGFRRIGYEDILHFEFITNWRRNKFLIDPTWLKNGGILGDMARCHPMYSRILVAGLLPQSTFAVLSLLMDPRRFVNPSNSADTSIFYSQLGLERDNRDLFMQAGTNGMFTVLNDVQRDIRDRLWCWLWTTWLHTDESRKPTYFQSEAVKFSGLDNYLLALRDYETVEHVNRHVAEYLRSTWLDELNNWRSFCPYAFFHDREMADKYNSLFPVH